MAKAKVKLQLLQNYLDYPDRYMLIFEHAWKVFPDYTTLGDFNFGWDAGLIGKKMRFSLLSVALSVLICQVVGMTFEYLMDFNFLHALQDVRIGWPGILIQVFGGWLLLKAIEKW